MPSAPPPHLPVFPLPDLVLFPHAVVPLHVFELRYRTLVRDALSAGRVIAMALLKPGWERDYHGSPEFHLLGCLAHIEEVEWLPNDCYDLVVRGGPRVRLGRIVREYPYRAAQWEPLPQEPYTEDDPLVASERHALLELYGRLAGSPIEAGAAAARGSEPGYEKLVNAVCMIVEADPLEKLTLLGLDSVIERGARVRELAARRALGPPGPAPGGEHN